MNIFSKVASLTLFGAISLSAVSLDSLIVASLQEHPSLQAIKERISSANITVLLSRKLSNPKLTLNINDIQLNDINNRSIERMQSSAITLEQKLPYFGKLDLKEKSALANKETKIFMLEEAKALLVSKIKHSAYKVWELTTMYSIICKFEELTQQSIDLSTAYTVTTPNQHMGIMSATMSLSNLKIRKNRLLQAMEAEYANLSYLSTKQVFDLQIELFMPKLTTLKVLIKELQNNFTIKAQASSVKEAKALLKSRALEAYPDPTIKAGYFYRNSYEDYLSLAIGITLPIYGIEKLKSQRQRKKLLESKSILNNTQKRVQSELEAHYAYMRQAHTTYTILTKESMPQIEHMFDLSSSSITAGGDLFKYIDLIKQELRLEEQRISAVAEYYKHNASIEALLGVQK